ncbi:hypothetical protein [Macrococcus bovicus]
MMRLRLAFLAQRLFNQTLVTIMVFKLIDFVDGVNHPHILTSFLL